MQVVREARACAEAGVDAPGLACTFVEFVGPANQKQIVNAMKSGTSELIELTCEKQTEKKVAVMSDQISAVILSQKDGSAAAGRVPGFFALADAE